ncbi:hypothetical protein DNTS_007267 [Danionella cerebrum]|uniref:Uncharacterized protein n=1 Tax=Danionella cerebrum TaxID=2873325 RepID=A0A553RE12_9TELE|nr:hypothetical protein DNTS_007267 [Danionella translucida]
MPDDSSSSDSSDYLYQNPRSVSPSTEEYITDIGDQDSNPSTITEVDLDEDLLKELEAAKAAEALKEETIEVSDSVEGDKAPEVQAHDSSSSDSSDYLYQNPRSASPSTEEYITDIGDQDSNASTITEVDLDEDLLKELEAAKAAEALKEETIEVSDNDSSSSDSSDYLYQNTRSVSPSTEEYITDIGDQDSNASAITEVDLDEDLLKELEAAKAAEALKEETIERIRPYNFGRLGLRNFILMRDIFPILSYVYNLLRRDIRNFRLLRSTVS